MSVAHAFGYHGFLHGRSWQEVEAQGREGGYVMRDVKKGYDEAARRYRQKNPIREVVTLSHNPSDNVNLALFAALLAGTAFLYYYLKPKEAAAASNEKQPTTIAPKHLGQRPILQPNDPVLVMGDGYANTVIANLGNDPTLQANGNSPWSTPIQMSIADARSFDWTKATNLPNAHVVLLAFSPGSTSHATAGDVDGLESVLVAAGKRPIWVLAPGDETSAFGDYLASIPTYEYYAMGLGNVPELAFDLTTAPVQQAQAHPPVTAANA